MYLKIYYCILSILVLLIRINCQDQKFEYSIEVPKFPCYKADEKKMGVTIIRLLGKDSQKLQYRFTINFNQTKNCINQSQRCTLIAWRDVRNLEQYLRNIILSQTDLHEININNTVLNSDLQYIINVEISNNGSFLQNRQFILECTNSTTATNANKSDTIVSTTATNVIKSDTILSTTAANVIKSDAILSTTATNVIKSDTILSTTATNVIKTDTIMSTTATNVIESDTILPTTATNVIKSDTILSTTVTNVIESDTILSTTATNVIKSDTILSTTATNVIKSDTILSTTATNVIKSDTIVFEQNSLDCLVFLGTNGTYRDMTYVLNAKVTCNRNDSFYFKWDILDESENLIVNNPTRGSEFQFNFGLLNRTDGYVIRCNLVSSLKDEHIDVALQNVKILKRDMTLTLPITTLVVGLRKPFKLMAYLSIDDTEEKLKIEWLCEYKNGKCLGFKPLEFRHQPKSNLISFDCEGFAEVGSYNITVIVTEGNLIKKSSCEIQVVTKAFARIDVENIGVNIDPSKKIEVPVYVAEVITGCTLEWTMVESLGYTWLNLTTIPGLNNTKLNVTVTEDEFLNEIDEFSEDSLDIEFNLKIPAPKDKWKGLAGNSSYLFRLNVTCPVAQEENDSGDEGKESVLSQSCVSIYADIILNTDSLPNLNALEVTPHEGIALKTLFKFVYKSNDTNSSFYPVLYKFGYILNNELIFIANLLDVKDTESVLPYLDDGVKTVLEGCNSHSLCAQVFGPIIITTQPQISEEDQKDLNRQLNDLLYREEYYKFFTYSLAIVKSFNNTNDLKLGNYMLNVFSNLTSIEIKRLLMLNVDGDKSWKLPASNLLKYIGLLLNHISPSTILLNNVVALRNEIRKSALSVNYRTRQLLTMQSNHRFKRQTDKITLEEVKSYLVISELIITTSPDRKRVRQEKQNLLNQVEKLMQGLCITLYEKPQTMDLELKTLILSVEKVNKNSFSKYIHILYPDNSWNVKGRIKLGKCFSDELSKESQLCLGKVSFKNYLNKRGLVYMVKFFNADPNDQSDFQDISCDSILVLPLEDKQIEGKEAKCALWKKRWNTSHCKTLHITMANIQCACNNLGFYSLEYSTPISTTTQDTQFLTDQSNDILTLEEPTSPYIATTELSSFSAVVDWITSDINMVSEGNDIIMGAEPKDNEVEITGVLTTAVDDLLVNISLATMYGNLSEKEDIILYCVIACSLIGIGILIYGIKKLLSHDESASNDDFPIYARLYHEEMLDDVPNVSE